MEKKTLHLAFIGGLLGVLLGFVVGTIFADSRYADAHAQAKKIANLKPEMEPAYVASVTCGTELAPFFFAILGGVAGVIGGSVKGVRTLPAAHGDER